MAFTQSSLVDIIFKKYITNKSTTDNQRQYFEEPYSSSKNSFSSDIWLQSDQIPVTASEVPGIVQYISATLSHVPGTPGSFFTSSLVDIIPDSFNSSYNYGIFRNGGTTSIPLGQCDWLFDPNAGVLTFYTGASNGTITDPLTSTVIASAGAPPVVKVYKYIGKKGIIPNLNGLTYSNGTMSVDIGFGLTYSNGRLQTVLTTVAGNGLTNSGNTFSINLTNNSGLTVSSNGLSITNAISGIGITFTNGQISLTNPIFFANGITNSGNTYSVNINNNGLTFSNSQVSLNIGSGLTFSTGQLLINLAANSGLQFSSNALSLSSTVSGAGLTFTGGQIRLNIGAGLTAQNNQLTLNLGSGLTTSQNVLNLTRMLGNNFPATAVGGQVFLRTDLGLTSGVAYIYNDNLNRWNSLSQVVSDSNVFITSATGSDFAFTVLPSTSSLSSDTFGYPLFQVYPQGGFVASSRRIGTNPLTTGSTASVENWPYIFRVASSNIQGSRLGLFSFGSTGSTWIMQTDNGTAVAESPPSLEIQRVGLTIIGRSSGSRGLIIGEMSNSPLSKLHIVGVGSNLGYLSISPSGNTDREIITFTFEENFGVNGQIGIDSSTSLMGAFISPNSPSIIASMSSSLIANLRTGNSIRLIQGASSSNIANLSFEGNPILIREVGTNSITLNTICLGLGGSTVSLTRVVFNDKPTSDFQYQGLFSIGNPLVITASSLLPSIAVQGLNSRNDNGGNYVGVTTSSTFYSVDSSIQNLTYTLPDARVTPGRLFMFNKIDSSSSSVTFQTTYTQSILGLTSHTLWNQYDSMTLVARSTGTQGFWEVQSMYKEIEDKVYIRSRNSSATHSIFYVNNSNNSNILTITNNRNVGIGTTSPTNLFHIFGTGSNFRLQDGSQGSGRYLVSDNDGVASWTSSITQNGPTWTPTLRGSVSDPTYSATSSTPLSRILRLGNNMTHLHCYIEIPVSSISGGSGSVFITSPAFTGSTAGSGFNVIGTGNPMPGVFFGTSSGTSSVSGNSTLIGDKFLIQVNDPGKIYLCDSANPLRWNNLNLGTGSNLIIAMNILVQTF